MEVTDFQGRRRRQKPFVMEHLAWDRLINVLQMQRRCFCGVCVSVLYKWRDRGLARKSQADYFWLQGYVPLTTSCSFSEEMTLAGVEEAWNSFTEASSLARTAWALQSCASWRWVTGTVSLVVRHVCF